MKLLVDGFNRGEVFTDVKTLVTEETGGKKYYIKGIFAQAEQRNRNGRLYSRDVMHKALEEYQPLIRAKRALGEMMHPSHPNVNLERASHLIESLSWDGDNIVGKARILESMPMGKIAKGLIDEGVQLGVSTRGLGSLVEKNGVNLVQPDFVMTAIDIVGDPSAPDAFVEGIMEGSEWIYDATSQSWVLAEQIKSNIKKMNTRQLAESQARMFSEFLNSLK